MKPKSTQPQTTGRRFGNGAGVGGPASGKPARAFSAEHQPPAVAKFLGKQLREEWRAKMAAKLETVNAAYDLALADPDNRVKLQAAKQVTAEIWPNLPDIGGDMEGVTEVRYRWASPKTIEHDDS